MNTLNNVGVHLMSLREREPLLGGRERMEERNRRERRRKEMVAESGREVT